MSDMDENDDLAAAEAPALATDSPEIIAVGDRRTAAHLRPLASDEAEALAPATHRGTCLAVEGLVPGLTLDYAGRRFEVLEVWDESERRAKALARSRQASRRIRAFHAARTGKFLDMLLREVDA